jgi:hypothetical protein
MAYGHAERTLAAIRLLEAETRELLSGLAELDSEQARWLEEMARADVPGRNVGLHSPIAPAA